MEKIGFPKKCKLIDFPGDPAGRGLETITLVAGPTFQNHPSEPTKPARHIGIHCGTVNSEGLRHISFKEGASIGQRDAKSYPIALPIGEDRLKPLLMEVDEQLRLISTVGNNRSFTNQKKGDLNFLRENIEKEIELRKGTKS